MSRLLLCTDLDRTLLPNGGAEESPCARDLFSRLVAHAEVTLAYVTGRDRRLVEAAMKTYQLPSPDFVIGDVGSTIHETSDGRWRNWSAWSEHIAPDWKGMRSEQLAPLLDSISQLRIQEPRKQNTYKLSYYTDPGVDTGALELAIAERLSARGIRFNLVWSIDETEHLGLLDILPAHAGKLEALEFLHQTLGFDYAHTLFAGDSGNDLSVLASAIPSVLVANATPAVAEQALQAARRAGTEGRLYLARGGYLGMNGNYAAGILEGVAHFHPEMTREPEQYHA